MLLRQDTLFALILGGVPLLLITLAFYLGNHNAEAQAMHREHDEYVRHQEMCAVRNAWYVHSENYHGLLACRRLDNHERFYMVDETGLALVPAE